MKSGTFYRTHAFPVTQSTALKHWRKLVQCSGLASMDS